ncbi:MAG TPA: type IV secretion system DNA-binding domain-containing protein [Terriglobales bacterium]|nr:type IV secretion system DNA-binding domain-containing protein [Terriglobales bacterium]
MIQRALASKGVVAYVLACATGITLYFRMPFPEDDLMLHLIELRAPMIYLFFKYSYTLFLFTTPYIAYSLVLSGLYVFAFRPTRKVKPMPLPSYPDPARRNELFLVLGEVHHPRKPEPSPSPYWLTIPERGLFTGTAIFGAIGTGKTSGCMYPYAEQLIAYQCHDREKRMGGLVLEVKGDFCHKIKGILKKYGRGEDYVEVNLNAEYRYNPLYNDLDAYALAYNIASLLNNLFGRGKEPFWQQAYTNLVKFIIQLHKVVYDYVTLFDVYECAINPDLLESRIQEAERKLTAQSYCVISSQAFLEQHNLEQFGFCHDPQVKGYKAPQSPALEEALKAAGIEFRIEKENPPEPFDPIKREILDGVKRWFTNDWRRIENKLRTSIVEGISVFLSLFDDNPVVKRTFCPPKECYDPVLNLDGKYGRPLPLFSELIESGKVCALNFPVSLNPGLAKAIGVMMKLDFQRAMLNRIPKIENSKDRYFRQAFFICDEYQHFATVGENDPNGDEKFFALSRQSKCIPIVATQSISSLRSTLPGETWRTLLQTFRTNIFLALSDEFSAKIASELCGKEDQWKVNYNISESGHDARVSLWTGKAIAHRANVTTSKSYNTLSDFRFDFKTFTELKNAQSVTLAYDGLNPEPPVFMYLKPYYNDVNKSYFRQLADGEL